MHACVEVWVGSCTPVDAAMQGDFFDATHVKLAEGDDPDANISIAVWKRLSENLSIQILETEER
ncbi:MAG: hypothetical protein HY716_11605 [Planctomycetes bacterium]|nr:hypothetical protein [Planctomycetota bacterium]